MQNSLIHFLSTATDIIIIVIVSISIQQTILLLPHNFMELFEM